MPQFFFYRFILFRRPSDIQAAFAFGGLMSCIAVDLGGVFAHLDDVARRQIPFAAKNTVNKLAANVIEAEQAEMASVFGNPRQWTLNSLFVRQYADKHNLTAVVDFKDSASNRSAGKYLQAQIYGGTRKTKGIERFLVSRGLMPAGFRIVPSDSVRLDQYGNITLAAFRSMLRGINDGRNFALTRTRGRLKPGIYRRNKKGVRALVMYVSSAEYEKRMRYFETARQAVERNSGQIAAAELENALRTAR